MQFACFGDILDKKCPRERRVHLSLNLFFLLPIVWEMFCLGTRGIKRSLSHIVQRGQCARFGPAISDLCTDSCPPMQQSVGVANSGGWQQAMILGFGAMWRLRSKLPGQLWCSEHRPSEVWPNWPFFVFHFTRFERKVDGIGGFGSIQ